MLKWCLLGTKWCYDALHLSWEVRISEFPLGISTGSPREGSSLTLKVELTFSNPMSKSKIGSFTHCIGTALICVWLNHSITQHCPNFICAHPCLYAQNTTSCIINWYCQQLIMANLVRTRVLSSCTGTWPTQNIASFAAPTSEVNGTHHYFVATATDCHHKTDIDREENYLFLVSGNNLYTYSMSRVVFWLRSMWTWVFKCADKRSSVTGGTSELYFLDCCPWALQPLCHYTSENYSFTTKLYTSAVFWRTDSCFMGG